MTDSIKPKVSDTFGYIDELVDRYNNGQIDKDYCFGMMVTRLESLSRELGRGELGNRELGNCSETRLPPDVVANKLLDTQDFNDQVGLICDLDPDDWHQVAKELVLIERALFRHIEMRKRTLAKIKHLQAIRQMKDIADRATWLNDPGTYLKRLAKLEFSDTDLKG